MAAIAKALKKLCMQQRCRANAVMEVEVQTAAGLQKQAYKSHKNPSISKMISDMLIDILLTGII